MSTTASEIVYPSTAVNRCPYPHMAQLRKEAPVHKVPGRNEFVVSRYDDIKSVLRRPEIFSSIAFVMENGRMRPANLGDVRPDRVAGIQATDDPVHAKKRKLAFQFFKPSLIPGYEPFIRQTVDELIDQFAGESQVEFISRFASPLPARVMFHILGLPEEDLGHADLWARYDGQGTRYSDMDQSALIQEALLDMGGYLGAAISARKDDPNGDVLSRWVHAHLEADGEFDLPNLIADASNLVVGGIATTGHMLGSTMRLLLQHPETLARVREDGSLIVKAIEESLRLESPIQWNTRMALEDTSIDGVDITAGSLVVVAYCSANRDEQHFGDADAFDIDRSELKDHIGFGHGAHFCMGAPLARTEGRIAFERLFARFGDVRLSERNDFDVLDSIALRGLASLWLDLGHTG